MEKQRNHGKETMRSFSEGYCKVIEILLRFDLNHRIEEGLYSRFAHILLAETRMTTSESQLQEGLEMLTRKRNGITAMEKRS